MKIQQPAERLVYVVIVVLALIAAALVLASPDDFTKIDLVYKGF